MVTEGTLSRRSRTKGIKLGVNVPLDSIRDAGTYVCQWSGQLLRVPASAVGPNGAFFNIVGLTPLLVTKISHDPALPVTRARRAADDMSLKVCF
jgi:hypothetical protein